MSLDFSLIADEKVMIKHTGVYVRKNGANVELTSKDIKEIWPDYDVQEFEAKTNEVFTANITHNLNQMAKAADIYDTLWYPKTINIIKAKNAINKLEKGLNKLKNDPEYFKEFNSSNGWGTYEQFVSFVEKVLQACKEYPEANIEVSI